MIKPATLAGCFVLDLACGDPEWFPHPVRVIGKAVEQLEIRARQVIENSGEELIAGAILTALITGGVFSGSRACLQRIRRKSSRLGIVLEILLGWTALALRSLLDEASAVIEAIEADRLDLARDRLARIVGRDTKGLNEQEILRAVIETVAESTCDGVIAPIFYLVLGGLPLALAFKAISTLDSMIGHRDARYLYFGRVAARLDDVANYVPARLSAVAIAIAASFMRETSGRSAFSVWMRDGHKHPSPNAGNPEAAIAGALQVRLGGTNSYDGEEHSMPYLGEEFPRPTIRDGRRALSLALGASIMAMTVSIGLAAWRRCDS